MAQKINYIGLGLNYECNKDCFYCKKTGESINSNRRETLKFDDWKKNVKIAYSQGIDIFRLTGGEPTLLDYLPYLIKYIMQLGDDTKIRLNTNGFNLGNEDILNAMDSYKHRINIVISVDSVNEYINGIHFPKFLSPKVKTLVHQLITKEYSIRFNTVVTKYNISEVIPLIDESLNLGVNMKLLDLIIRDEYYGLEKYISGKDAIIFGNNSYQSLEPIIEYLQKISCQKQDSFHTWNGHGIKMEGFFFGDNQYVQVKNSKKGAEYSNICIEKCPHFPSCKEGLFSPFISADNILHPAGCMNDEFYFDLNGKDEGEIANCFEQILTMFNETVFIKK